MTDRPYVLISCALSVDGCLDDASDDRLLLSNAADFDRVDEERAGCDAILVGANTIRRDNPRLRIRSPERRAARVRAGKPADPIRVTLTRSGRLDPEAAFFTSGAAARLVYCTSKAVPARLDDRATVVDMGPELDLPLLLADLAERGVRRLMVEGGSGVLEQLLTAGSVDELQLAIAPLLVGDPAAPRFVGGRGTPLRLAEVRRLDDVVLLRYLASGPSPG